MVFVWQSRELFSNDHDGMTDLVEKEEVFAGFVMCISNFGDLFMRRILITVLQ